MAPRSTSATLFGIVFAAMSHCSSPTPGASRAATPVADDMEPMSWAIYSMVSELGALEQLAGNVQPPVVRARSGAALEPFDALLTPALAERPLPLGTLDTGGAEPDVDVHAVGPLHAVHADRERDRPARGVAAP